MPEEMRPEEMRPEEMRPEETGVDMTTADVAGGRPADRHVASGERPPPPRILVVTDGSDDSARAAGVAAELFPDARLEIMTAIPLTRDVYEGTTGFAGPVVDDDELTQLERSRTVAAMGATASTARRLGPRPAHRIERPGEPIEAVRAEVQDSESDVVVVASTGRGAPDTITPVVGDLVGDLVDRLDVPVLVVPAPEGRNV